MSKKIIGKWAEVFKEETNKEYFQNIREIIHKEKENYRIFPENKDVFNAFVYTPYEKVKVVILGQDPYHEINQAHGLAFSVLPGCPLPPSLQNIFKEIENEFNYEMPKNYGCLQKWANQGVFLLNTVLTVREHQANSHKNIGWSIFVNRVIEELNNKKEPVIWLLWGGNAKQYRPLLNNPNHLVLQSVHPSPLSANRGGWFGNQHFIKTNEFLRNHGQTEIDWKL